MSAFWDYVTGYPWAMERGTFDRLRMVLSRHAAGVRLSAEEISSAIGRPASAPNPADRTYIVHAGVAIVPVQGILARHAEEVGGISQPSGTSYEAVERHLRNAVADPSVERILLAIESPGGSVNGLRNAVEAVRTARQSKPVDALIDGLGCSAAYWIAAAAERVFATNDAMVGSIGTVWPWYDDSAAFAKEGIRPVILRSGPDKAAGQPGEALKAEWIGHLQQMVDQLGGAFVASVTEFRDLTDDQAKAIASGNFWLPDEAQRLGLIDGITTLDALLATMANGDDANVDRAEVTGDPVEVVVTLGADAGASQSANTRTLTAAGMSPAAATAAPAAPTPANPAGTDTMKITAQVLLALIASAPEHLPLISSMANGDPSKGVQPATEDEIRAAITTAKTKGLTDRVTALEQQLAAEKTASATTLAAKDADITALKAKVDQLGALGKNAAQDPGADPKGADAANAGTAQVRLEAEWQGLTPEQRMGFCNDIDGFKAWKANAGRDHKHAAEEAAERAANAAKKG